MTWTVREVDVDAARADLLGLLARHFEGWRAEPAAKFAWSYLNNPFGRARAWVLESGSRILGLSAAFPRRLRACGESVEAWVLGDFCVDRELRSLGPALALQRELFSAAERGEVDAWYDFPSRTMLAIYRRMGLSPAGELVRMVYPLRIDDLVARKLTVDTLAKGLSAVGNLALAARDSLRRRRPGVEVRALEGGLETTPDFGRGRADGVFVERTPEYLDWRYRDDPRGSASVLAAWRRGACGGFLVSRPSGDRHAILDLFGVDDEVVFEHLIQAAIAEARNDRASSLTVHLSRVHPWFGRLEELGFHPRDGAAYVVHARRGALPEGAPWFLAGGDRDT